MKCKRFFICIDVETKVYTNLNIAVMKTSTLLKCVNNALLLFALTFFSVNNIVAQVIRPYNLVYSNNLKGGHTMFGNASLTIKDANGVVQTSQVNDFGSYSNGTTSQYAVYRS